MVSTSEQPKNPKPKEEPRVKVKMNPELVKRDYNSVVVGGEVFRPDEVKEVQSKLYDEQGKSFIGYQYIVKA